MQLSSGPVAFSGFQNVQPGGASAALQHTLERQLSNLGIKVQRDPKGSTIVIVNGDDLKPDIAQLAELGKPYGSYRVAVLGLAETLPPAFRNIFPGGVLYIQKPVFPPDLWRILRTRPARSDVAEMGSHVGEPDLSDLKQHESIPIQPSDDGSKSEAARPQLSDARTQSDDDVRETDNEVSSKRGADRLKVLVVEDNLIVSLILDSFVFSNKCIECEPIIEPQDPCANVERFGKQESTKFTIQVKAQAD